MVAPDNRFVLVSDLGTDKIISYKLDAANGRIEDAKQPFVSVKPGCGPRHFDFHPNGNFGYSVEELTSTVGVFSYNKVNGSLNILADSIPSLPADFKGKNTSICPTGATIPSQFSQLIKAD
jgi:6-phosphogluconolactonase